MKWKQLYECPVHGWIRPVRVEITDPETDDWEIHYECSRAECYLAVVPVIKDGRPVGELLIEEEGL